MRAKQCTAHDTDDSPYERGPGQQNRYRTRPQSSDTARTASQRFSLTQQKAAISADRRLTNQGKDAALKEARAKRDAAITEWHEGRLKNIDADLLQQRAALITQRDTPDPRRVELMAAQMLKHDVSDLPIFYNSATEPERRVMEAASASVGRVPVKSANGKEWKVLLDPEIVNESIMARAEATNPEAAQRVRELQEIKAMQTTIAGVALSEV